MKKNLPILLLLIIYSFLQSCSTPRQSQHPKSYSSRNQSNVAITKGKNNKTNQKNVTEQINSEEQSIQYNSVNINWAELRNIITDLSARGNTAFNGNPPEEFTENINEYKNTLENMKKNENATPSDKKALTDRLNRLKELEKIMENQLKQAP